MEVVNRPRSRLPGPLGEVRSRLGDKELAVGGSMVGAGAGTMGDSRAYQLEKPDKDQYMYDDVAWYEGRYPSQVQEGAAEGRSRRGGWQGRAGCGTLCGGRCLVQYLAVALGANCQCQSLSRSCSDRAGLFGLIVDLAAQRGCHTLNVCLFDCWASAGSTDYN
jgi:hypothetical protein